MAGTSADSADASTEAEGGADTAGTGPSADAKGGEAADTASSTTPTDASPESATETTGTETGATTDINETASDDAPASGGVDAADDTATTDTPAAEATEAHTPPEQAPEIASALADAAAEVVAAHNSDLPALSARQCQERFDILLQTRRVRFASGNAHLSADSLPLLKRLARLANRCQGFTLEVGGHTDNTGNDALNRRLSGQRAQVVRQFLIAAGYPSHRIDARGYGDSRPVADNTTESGRARNRRVEITVSALPHPSQNQNE